MVLGLARTDLESAPPAVGVNHDHGDRSPRVVVFTTLYPNPAQPRLGVFVRDRVVAVAQHCPTRVVAPVLTRWPARRLDQGSAAAVPTVERQAGLDVQHPRFTTLPGIGRAADGLLLYLQTLPAIRRLRTEFAFDLIDAHYAFPDGAAAVLLARRFGVPVCVTLRGGDIDLLPQFRMRRRAIRRTLQRADRVFAVSEHLARGAAALGLPRERIEVVPNGIDPAKFFRVDRRTARERLGIPEPLQMVLCVANLLAEKGQHVLIEALARLAGEPAPHVTIIGSDQWGKQQYARQIARRATELGLDERVQLIGSRPQEELVMWYSAADVVVLPTFREGCPNVVREAFACGAPVIASRVGGVPELITSDALGLLVEPGDADGLAIALRTALRRQWDRGAIAAIGGQRAWPAVGIAIARELRTLVPKETMVNL